MAMNYTNSSNWVIWSGAWAKSAINDIFCTFPHNFRLHKKSRLGQGNLETLEVSRKPVFQPSQMALEGMFSDPTQITLTFELKSELNY